MINFHSFVHHKETFLVNFFQKQITPLTWPLLFVGLQAVSTLRGNFGMMGDARFSRLCKWMQQKSFETEVTYRNNTRHQKTSTWISCLTATRHVTWRRMSQCATNGRGEREKGTLRDYEFRATCFVMTLWLTFVLSERGYWITVIYMLELLATNAHENPLRYSRKLSDTSTWTIGVLFPVGKVFFTLRHCCVQTGSGTHPLPRLRMWGTIPPLLHTS
jgi:hypothetical protein